MTVYELDRDQLTELKQNYYTQLLDERGESPSYGELADIDDYVSDEEIFDEYAGTDFVPDDFACSAGEDEAPSLSEQLADIIEQLRDIKGQGWWAFESPSPSSTESKIKQGVFNAIQFLESARRAAIDSHI